MPWPLGQPRSEETKRKLRAAHLRRCADPLVKATWRGTPAALRYWYADHKPFVGHKRAESNKGGQNDG